MLDTSDNKHTLTTCNTHCFFHYNNGYTKALRCYVTSTLPVSFYMKTTKFIWKLVQDMIRV